MFSLKNVIIGFLIILTLSIGVGSIFMTKRSTTSPTDTTRRPDAFMEDVVATIINKEGRPSLKVESPKMVHYADNDTTDINTPHITLYRQSPEPWYIDSTYAKATQGLDKIFFWDHVVVHHVNDTANPTTTMTTATLTVFPDKQIAQTNDSVTLIQPSTTIYGLGMSANLNEGTVHLLSQARGEYVPNPS